MTAATLTIETWKDGVARGKITFETSRKVRGTVTFVARLPDHDGLLKEATK